MTQLPQPDIEAAKRRAAKVQEICKRADAGIAVLDDLIARLEKDIFASKLYQYRLRRAKESGKSLSQ
jgi:hypothetical protein